MSAYGLFFIARGRKMNKEKPKFEFYEKMRVISDDPEAAEVRGELGVIMAQSDEGEPYEYAVFIYRDEICRDLDEDEIESAGEFDSRENLYDSGSFRVSVDKDGHGTVR
jgi:hypothetical protein